MPYIAMSIIVGTLIICATVLVLHDHPWFAGALIFCAVGTSVIHETRID